jgi:PilZ domain
MGSVPPPTSGDNNPQRRSQRVMVKVSVMVLAEGADKKSASEETRTVTVNAHGAMILLGLQVSIGQLLTLRNERTGGEVACRVVYLSPHESEKRQVGVDFMNPCPRPSVLAHLLSSTGLDNSKSGSQRQKKVIQKHTTKLKTQEMRSAS